MNTDRIKGYGFPDAMRALKAGCRVQHDGWVFWLVGDRLLAESTSASIRWPGEPSFTARDIAAVDWVIYPPDAGFLEKLKTVVWTADNLEQSGVLAAFRSAAADRGIELVVRSPIWPTEPAQITFKTTESRTNKIGEFLRMVDSVEVESESSLFDDFVMPARRTDPC